MTLGMFCMVGFNHTCQLDVSCIWWSLSLRMFYWKYWCVYRQVTNVMWTWNIPKPLQHLVNGSPKVVVRNCQIIYISNVQYMNIVDELALPCLCACEILWKLVCFSLLVFFFFIIFLWKKTACTLCQFKWNRVKPSGMKHLPLLIQVLHFTS